MVELDLGVAPTVLAKLEFLNPGGSLKDRSALFMIEDAEKKGLLKPGGTIVEATSGNQGIALAMIGALKGYRVIITTPDRTATEKLAMLRAYGAEVHVCPNTDSHLDPRGYHAMAERFVEEIDGAFMPDQYFNPLNAQAHYYSMGPDVWEQSQEKITHFIAGAGTCGTISGAGRFLKEKNSNIKVIGVDAATSFYSSDSPKAYNVEGLGIDVESDVFDKNVIDTIIPITDEDAFASTRALAKQGLLVGISSGAVVHVARQYAKTLSKDNVIVILLADSGRSYLSKVFASQHIEPTVSALGETLVKGAIEL